MSRPARSPVRPRAAPSEPGPAPDSGNASGSSSVQAVGVAFDVLEALAHSPGPVGTSELARRLGQTKARVHRHLATLRELGFVEQDASTAYTLGWRAYRLGVSVGENFGLRKLAEPHLAKLQRESGQTAVLAGPADADIVVIDAKESAEAVAITVRAGSVIPAASSALGRAMLAFRDEDALEAALASPLQPPRGPSPRDPRKLRQMLQQVRDQGWAVASSERLPGVSALAAPVFDGRGRVAGAVGVIGSQGVITDPPPAALLRQVQQAAAAISAALGLGAGPERVPGPSA